MSYDGWSSWLLSVSFSRFLETVSLNFLVSLTNTSSTLKRFQSFLIDWSRLLKKSSNSTLRLSLIKIIWLRSFILFWVMLLDMVSLTWCSLFLTSLRACSIYDCRDSEKSRFSSELRGTTGWSKWVDLRHLLQTFCWSLRQKRISSSWWVSQTLGSFVGPSSS